jgi:hypothetical protein
VTNKTRWEFRLELVEFKGAHEYVWIGQTAGFLAAVIMDFLILRWLIKKKIIWIGDRDSS